MCTHGYSIETGLTSVEISVSGDCVERPVLPPPVAIYNRQHNSLAHYGLQVGGCGSPVTAETTGVGGVSSRSPIARQSNNIEVRYIHQ